MITGTGGGNSAAGQQASADYREYIYLADHELEHQAPWDSGTETDTSSDSNNEPMDYSDLNDPVNPLTEEEKAHQLYYNQRYHRKKYRRFFRKPTRRVRRFVKKYTYFAKARKGKGKGKGKHGKGKGRGSFMFLGQELEAPFTTVKFT